MLEPIQEEIKNARKLLIEGRAEEALEFVNTLEKWGDLQDCRKSSY